MIRVCQFGCETKWYLSRGLCPKHYQRLRIHGDPTVRLPAAAVPRKAVVKYRAAHARIEVDRGKASSQSCIDCERPAQQWSYNHSDPNELVEWDEFMSIWKAYSLDTDRYDPRCRSCHTKFDKSFEDA